jgi:N-acetylglucosaminyldiphosphoundecaprenol N-acetyl-beta-D-mannosaminyltransferase
MNKPTRVEVLGVPVDCVDMGQALDTVDAMIAGDRPQTVLAVNPEKVIVAQGDESALQSLQHAGLLIPDGIGVVFAVRFLTGREINRVPGSELMPAICARAEKKGYRVFLYGAAPDVNEKAVEVLKSRYPGLRVAGQQHGYLEEGGMPALIQAINASKADVLFVALGSPRQEIWMAKYLPQLEVKVCQGVGGTFDVLAGRVKRAPAIFRKLHLEWFYRLATDPRRLLRQTALPRFFFQVIRAKIVDRG